jgi:hypothetical protein
MDENNIRSSSERFEESLYETGFLCQFKDSKETCQFGVRVLCPEAFDVGFVMDDCLGYCRENHDSCEPLSSLAMNRVIDCRTRMIVAALVNCQYVALSYVWGVADPSLPAEGELETQNFPKVINDSIVVTLTLQFHYLWVDRYCIDQSSSSDKIDQIRQMD